MKRVFDVVLSALALILLAPVLLVIAIAIILDTGLPVFYRQDRVGLHFHVFKILKFRSMHQNNGGSLITISGDPRVTGVGKILRITKLDELPQFWNVLLGDMSLVGPRPEVPHYVELFKNRYSLILSVRPGITDLASIEFRNEEQVLRESHEPLKAYIEEVLPAKLDLADKYVRNHSVIGDVLILFRTALKLI